MKKTCTVIALALALALLVSFAVLSTGAAGEPSKWDGTSVSTELKTDADGAYLIQSAADLAFFAKSVKDGTTYEGKTVKLTTDIVWNEGDASTWAKETTGLNKWTSIGYPGKPFKGTFDGQGHTLSGVWGAETHWRYGLFSQVAGATIKNFAVVNSALFASDQQSGGFIGAVVGGPVTIDNCYVDIDFSMTAAKWYAGGLIGCLVDNGCAATIKNTVYAGNVKSGAAYVGGFIGSVRNGAQVQISDSAMIGSVTSTVANSWAGGFVGGTAAETSAVTITDSMALGTVVGKDDFGAVVSNRNKASCTMSATNLWVLDTACEGSGSFTGEIKKTAAELSALTSATLKTAGFENWIMTEANGAMPKVVATLMGYEEKASAPAFDGDIWDGTSVSTELKTDADGAYLIQSAADLAYYVKTVNSGAGTFNGKVVKLTKNIRWNDISNIDSWTATTTGLNSWTPIGKWGTASMFNGTFDGQGHTIDGLFGVSAEGNFGFFGVSWTATVKNLVLENSKFFFKHNNAGGLIGIHRAGNLTVENVYVDIDIEATSQYVGAVVGFLHGNGDFNATPVISFKNCVFAGTMNATNTYAGGFIGSFNPKASVSGADHCIKWDVRFEDCLALGPVTGKAAVGAFIGSHPAGLKEDSITITAKDNMILSTVAMATGGWMNHGAFAANLSLVNPASKVENLWFVDSLSKDTAFGALKTSGGTDLIPTAVTGAVEKTAAEINAATTEALAAAGFENWGLTAKGVLPKTVADLLGLEVIVDKDDNTDTSTDSSTNTGSGTTDTDTGSSDASTDTGSSNTSDTDKLPANPVVKPNLSDASVYSGTKSTTLRTEGNNVYIDSAADMAFFAEQVTGGNGYAGKTVILTTDIVWNNGDADTWTKDTTGLNSWVCGAWNKFFRGTFDGQGHTVSGLYQFSGGDNVGFFNGVGNTCVIKNLVLVNSTFIVDRTSGSANLGGLVGVMGEATKLTIDNVYVDVNLIANRAQTGGLIGRVHNGLCTVDITNAVFAGTINAESQIGGIVGGAAVNNNTAGTSTTLNITDTVVMGTIKGSGSAVAGVVGNNENGKTVLTNVVVVGTVEGGKQAAFLGAGKVDVTLNNCYYAEEAAKVVSAVGTPKGATAVKATDLAGKAVVNGWTALNGTYPMPASVAKMVNLSGNQNTSDFSATTAVVIAMIAVMAAAVVLFAKKRTA